MEQIYNFIHNNRIYSTFKFILEPTNILLVGWGVFTFLVTFQAVLNLDNPFLN